jgi:ribosomal protein L35
MVAKLKTRKSVLKRLKITGQKKLLRRPVHQNHFNAKETSQKTRRKRQLKKLTLVNQKEIKKLLPYI